ncbi:hypothetical protein F8M41_013912 [Gigaspora margarita]|uniref:Uncharacterized protein n=1 Tax=Gigaspora margarita TaxID=4874 RepID=A0A8H3WW70_GIGMA|nr:hypothetical protein F8M41_013912 [Gigaspora margarita]
MNRDPIVTCSKINSNNNKTSYNELDSSSSSNEQESDNFDELEVIQEIENLDNLIEFEQNQETESPDAEMYDNSSTLHNNENATENNLTAHSNRQQLLYVWRFFTVLATKQHRALVLRIDLDSLVIRYSALRDLQLFEDEWNILLIKYDGLVHF